MPHFGQNSSPTKLLTKTDSAKPVHNEADGRPDHPEVYKYRLLPQTSVEPNTTWLGDTEENPQYKESSDALLHQTHDKFFHL
jgi:hypothetical protein